MSETINTHLRTAAVYTLGCKVNQFESAAMTRMLSAAGYTIVPHGRPADVTLINTCTVTGRADFEARQLIRRAHRLNPDGRTIVTGCLAQVNPEEMAALPGVILVLGQNKADLTEWLNSAWPDQVTIPRGFPSPALNRLGFPVFDRTRAFFRIQDGCSVKCAYCAVPQARGPSRSLGLSDVTAGIEFYTDHGYAEVVLTGIHLGAWGADLNPPTSLTELIETLLIAGDGPRLRLSSIEPYEVTDRMIELVGVSSRLCPHWHLPLQSGSDRILAAMGRPYTSGFYANLMQRLSAVHQDSCLGADVLVGFPGEGENEFFETFQLLSRLPLAYMHVFPYSRRPGTPAADFPNQVPDREKKRRVALLRKLSGEKRQAFAQKCLGQIRPTLVENTPDPSTGLARGLTDNYLSILLPDPPSMKGTIIPIRIDRIAADGCLWGSSK
ncbi:MAG: tRNA (N(6)-L-threonylcarbamoyladenosine(37)-C(2))-methylthiotransferase MtaB [Deltaproteobacteria bacterium]|nr:tRNA (N(6)-L-threonylcarbamoyladenosine(37)-C(2))-methylthiotransferase MtaB [Deltaproteobacteria bacterium]